VEASPRQAGTIVVTGATGQIGYEAVRELAPLGKVIPLTREQLDLAGPEPAITKTIADLEPRVIINAAAYTAVDRAEIAGPEQAVCRAVNALGPTILAKVARDIDALLVHYSTDYVFNGRKGTPYVESDSPDPLSFYGRTKLEGEEAIQRVGGAYLILRTSWVYGTRGKNFLLTIRRLAREPRELRVVVDQVGAPTWSRWVATMTATVVASAMKRRRTGSADEISGVYHLSAGGIASWYDFAREILREDAIEKPVTRISSKEFNTMSQHPVAARPAYSVLDCAKFRDRFGLVRTDWREQLTSVFSELREGAPR
jgi:dTDP-4-dehydrorhamnose reductase